MLTYSDLVTELEFQAEAVDTNAHVLSASHQLTASAGALARKGGAAWEGGDGGDLSGALGTGK